VIAVAASVGARLNQCDPVASAAECQRSSETGEPATHNTDVCVDRFLKGRAVWKDVRSGGVPRPNVVGVDLVERFIGSYFASCVASTHAPIITAMAIFDESPQ